MAPGYLGWGVPQGASYSPRLLAKSRPEREKIWRRQRFFGGPLEGAAPEFTESDHKSPAGSSGLLKEALEMDRVRLFGQTTACCRAERGGTWLRYFQISGRFIAGERADAASSDHKWQSLSAPGRPSQKAAAEQTRYGHRVAGRVVGPSRNAA